MKFAVKKVKDAINGQRVRVWFVLPPCPALVSTKWINHRRSLSVRQTFNTKKNWINNAT